MKKLTKRQAAIIGLYTGISCGPFKDIHEYAEKIYNKPIFTHEFRSEDFVERLKVLAKPDFLKLVYTEQNEITK